MDELINNKNMLKLYKYYYYNNYSLERLSKMFNKDINVILDDLLKLDKSFALSDKVKHLNMSKMNVNKINFINNKIQSLNNKELMIKDKNLNDKFNKLKTELLVIKSKIIYELKLNSYIKYNTKDIIHLTKNNLLNNGYLSINDWFNNSNNVFIGSNLLDIEDSIWKNPYSSKKYGEELSLIFYENYLRNNLFLYNYIESFENKKLGCNCKNKLCHGFIILKLLEEINNNKIITIKLNDSDDDSVIYNNFNDIHDMYNLL